MTSTEFEYETTHVTVETREYPVGAFDHRSAVEMVVRGSAFLRLESFHLKSSHAESQSCRVGFSPGSSCRVGVMASFDSGPSHRIAVLPGGSHVESVISRQPQRIEVVKSHANTELCRFRFMPPLSRAAWGSVESESCRVPPAGRLAV